MIETTVFGKIITNITIGEKQLARDDKNKIITPYKPATPLLYIPSREYIISRTRARYIAYFSISYISISYIIKQIFHISYVISTLKS